MSKRKRRIEAKPVEEPTEEAVEVASDEQKTEEETAKAQPQTEETSEPEETVQAEEEDAVETEPVVELTQAERLALLPQQIMDIYNAAPAGHIPLETVLKETGASEIEIAQAWDKLYDQHKVPFSQLYKAEADAEATEES
jgi:hypothetical protein